MKNILKMAMIIMGLSFASTAVYAQASVIQITNCQGLQNINNNLSASYQLANDIDCSGFAFTPIGTLPSFTGTLSGLAADNKTYYQIKNLTINQTQLNSNAALFGSIQGSSSLPVTIQDLVLTNVNIRATSQVAGLAISTSMANISNVTINGVMGSPTSTPTGYIAGAFGQVGNSVKVNNVQVDLQVQGDVTDVISGFTFSNFGSINQSSAHVVINTQGSAMAFVADNEGTISNSYATGSVTAVNAAAGFVGYNGLANGAAISNSYAAVQVTGGNLDPRHNLLLTGGFVGNAGQGTVTNSFWDTDVSGQTVNAAGTGEHSAQMFQNSTYTGWDFNNTWTQYPHFKTATTTVATPGSAVAQAEALVDTFFQGILNGTTQVTSQGAQSFINSTISSLSTSDQQTVYGYYENKSVATVEAEITKFFSGILAGTIQVTQSNASTFEINVMAPVLATADQQTVYANYEQTAVSTAEQEIAKFFSGILAGTNQVTQSSASIFEINVMAPVLATADQQTVYANYEQIAVSTAEQEITKFFSGILAGTNQVTQSSASTFEINVMAPVLATTDQQTVYANYEQAAVSTAKQEITKFFSGILAGTNQVTQSSASTFEINVMAPVLASTDQQTVYANYEQTAVTTAETQITQYFNAHPSPSSSDAQNFLIGVMAPVLATADQQTVTSFFNQKLQGGGLSPDGSTLAVGASGSLVTSAGTWTFSTTVVSGNNLIFLNGKSASGYGNLLAVENQGKMYVKNNSNSWYVWTGSGWAGSSNPIPVGPPVVITASAGANGSISPSGAVNVQSGTSQIFTVTPNAGYSASISVDGAAATLTNNTYTFTSVTAVHTIAATFTLVPISPDGSTLAVGSSGSLATLAGTWTFSTTTASGNNLIFLNGKSASGYGILLVVANSGKMYTENAQGGWYLWNGSGWAASNDPLPNVTLTIAYTGAAVSNIASTPAGINCNDNSTTPGTCTASFPFGSAVALKATEGAGSFSWGGTAGCSNGPMTCSLTMTSNLTINANSSK